MPWNSVVGKILAIERLLPDGCRSKLKKQQSTILQRFTGKFYVLLRY